MITDADLQDVDAEHWVDVCVSLCTREDLTLDWLTAVDRGDGLQVLAHLVDPTQRRYVIVRTQVPAETPRIGSLTGHLPGADWHERETAEMFGITFEGGSTAALLLRTQVSSPPLRKSSPLTERVTTPWPGQEEKSRRRPKLPPGVRPEWVPDNE